MNDRPSSTFDARLATFSARELFLLDHIRRTNPELAEQQADSIRLQRRLVSRHRLNEFDVAPTGNGQAI